MSASASFVGGFLVFAGLVVSALSLPLVLGQVPMNRMYGIRIAAAYASPERWYAVNAYGGRQFAAWSCVMVLWGLAGCFIPADFAATYVSISPIGGLGPVIAAAVCTMRGVRGLSV